MNFEEEKEEKSEKKSMSERIEAFVRENESEMDIETRRLLLRAVAQAKVAERQEIMQKDVRYVAAVSKTIVYLEMEGKE